MNETLTIQYTGKSITTVKSRPSAVFHQVLRRGAWAAVREAA
ncbi:hypothetical protein [Streptomyces sp. NPDC008139]